MRLTFTYSNQPDLKGVPSYDIMEHSFQIPDEAKHLIGVEERIRAIGAYVAQLSAASVHLTCTDLGIKKERLSEKVLGNNSNESVVWMPYTTPILFSTQRFRGKKQIFKILSPIKSPLVASLGNRRGKRQPLSHHVIRFDNQWWKTQDEFEYAQLILNTAQQLEVLLNADPKRTWFPLGFHPYWYDNSVQSQQSKKNNAYYKALRAAEKAANKAKTKTSGTTTISTEHGKGRGYGAIPGVFKGVQMRSQLEIRFAAELEERGIDWIYELERLGAGQYLVDFYLPQLKIWVEVKGKFEARDNILLKDLAALLASERQERLYAYTSGKAIYIHNGEFIKLSKDEFWEAILKKD